MNTQSWGGEPMSKILNWLDDFLFTPDSDRWLALLRVGLGFQVVSFLFVTSRRLEPVVCGREQGICQPRPDRSNC